jgi:hypothetical protein
MNTGICDAGPLVAFMAGFMPALAGGAPHAA